jgi:hypothetical protein
MRLSSLFSCLKDQMACQVWKIKSAEMLQISLQQLHLPDWQWACPFEFDRVSFRQKIK